MLCTLHILIFYSTAMYLHQSRSFDDDLPVNTTLPYSARFQNGSCTSNHLRPLNRNKRIHRRDTLICVLATRKSLPWHRTVRRCWMEVRRTTTYLGTESGCKPIVELSLARSNTSVVITSNLTEFAVLLRSKIAKKTYIVQKSMEIKGHLKAFP